jgi:hypothetical protein
MATKRNANKHRSRHILRFCSTKNQYALKVESYLEYCHAAILECDPNVKSFASQAETMNLIIDGEKRSYTPDFMVRYKNGKTEFIEVHPSALIDDPFRQKIRDFSEHSYKSLGAKIRIVTEESLCKLSRVNYKLISEFSAIELTFDIEQAALPQSTTFGQLIKLLDNFTDSPINEAYRLLAIGHYDFDKKELLQNDTTIREVTYAGR